MSIDGSPEDETGRLSQLSSAVYCTVLPLCSVIRVATHLKKPGNPKYLGNSLNLENSWNFVLPQGKIITNKIVILNYLRRTTVD